LITALMMLLGLAIFGLGVYLYIVDSDIIAGVNVIGGILGAGFLLFLLGSIGCCGAYKKSTCWLCCYTWILFLLIAGQIAGVIMTTQKMFDIDGFLEERWLELDNDSRVTIQDRFECCGYPEFEDDIGEPCPTLDDPITIGCREKLEDVVTKILMEIYIVVSVLGFLEILMLILGCYLIRSIRKDSAVYENYD